LAGIHHRQVVHEKTYKLGGLGLCRLAARCLPSGGSLAGTQKTTQNI